MTDLNTQRPDIFLSNWILLSESYNERAFWTGQVAFHIDTGVFQYCLAQLPWKWSKSTQEISFNGQFFHTRYLRALFPEPSLKLPALSDFNPYKPNFFLASLSLRHYILSIHQHSVRCPSEHIDLLFLFASPRIYLKGDDVASFFLNIRQTGVCM